MLIRDGATLVRNATDVIAVIEAQRALDQAQTSQIPLPFERAPEPEHTTDRSLSETNKLHQKIDGQIKRAPGGMISRA